MRINRSDFDSAENFYEYRAAIEDAIDTLYLADLRAKEASAPKIVLGPLIDVLEGMEFEA